MTKLIKLYIPILTLALVLANNNVTAIPTDAEHYKNINDDGAWCWFSDPRAVYHKGKYSRTYIGYVNSHGDIIISSYDHDTTKIETKTIHKALQKDDHTNPSILFLQDGRLMIFYSRHGSPDGSYTITSKNPEDIHNWNQPILHKYNGRKKIARGYCYTNPIMLSAEQNKIFMFYRGDNWKPNFTYSNDQGKTWHHGKIFIGGKIKDNRPYLKVTSNNIDKIDFAFTDGHPRTTPLNSIHYMYYSKGRCYKADGTKIGTIGQKPINPKSTDLVYDAKKENQRAWVWDVAEDKTGKPIIVYTKFKSETEHIYCYARWDGTKWNNTTLGKAGKWFPQTKKEKKEREPHYSAGIYLDHQNPNNLYLAKPINGIMEIIKMSTTDNGQTFTQTQITKNSKYNNVRPYITQNIPPYTKPNLFWLNINDHYIHYSNYKTALKMNIKNIENKSEISPIAIKNIMEQVANWQIKHPKHHPLDWTNGAYLAGMSAWADIADNDQYYKYLKQWGDDNKWKLKSRIYHADDHCIGQTYLELYRHYKDPKMIADCKQKFNYIIKHQSKQGLKFGVPHCLDRWSWCDAIFMGPTVLAKLATITGEQKYLNFMHQEFMATTNYLYSKKEHLYYRDSRYFTQKEANQKPVFWGRGNGWVLGGLATIITELPTNWKHRPTYIKIFKQMAEVIAKQQQPDGLWRASMLDPNSYPNPETSSSGFFIYGLAWGINNGILDKKKYQLIVEKGWQALTKCVFANGKLGYIQPIGKDPKKVTAQMTEVYGVGAFLLAGAELYKLSLTKNKTYKKISATNPTNQPRTQDTIQINFAQLNISPKNIIVMDLDTGKILTNQLIDTNQDQKIDLLIFQSNFDPKQTRNFLIFNNKQILPPTPKTTCYARFVPERLDDFAWENDRIAFRMYGPALQKKPGNFAGNGIDVWVKRVSYPIINKWYKGRNYHKDNGEGMDGYKVGHTRGCGGIGLWENNKIIGAKHWISQKTITTGPIRTTFELTCAPYKINNRTITQKLRISLDAGSNLNKIEAYFTIDDNKPQQIIIGITRRGKAGIMLYNQEDNWFSYIEPTMPHAGKTYCGVILPNQPATFKDAQQHGMFLTTIRNKQTLTYYAGAAWNQNPNFKNNNKWLQYISQKAKSIKKPLIIKIN